MNGKFFELSYFNCNKRANSLAGKYILYVSAGVLDVVTHLRTTEFCFFFFGYGTHYIAVDFRNDIISIIPGCSFFFLSSASLR